MTVRYEYVGFELGPRSWRGFQSRLEGEIGAAVEATGGELLGLFAPQLGFGSNEATILLRWQDAQHVFEFPAMDGAVVRSTELLTATTRPRPDGQLALGGIYVHRWFTIDAEHSADFVRLSEQAWAEFEDSYDTQIFGLFEAEARDGAARFLLLTRYRDHAEWEASRTQTHDAKGLFAQRHLLTRSTIG
ncbi:MAG: NIPSNAP family protein, partial [Alphaproteobacteria bacterium]|nr:NIPSNAP family protein [Alphaproteobacteria bacterium]